jgi:hypothetical protein
MRIFARPFVFVIVLSSLGLFASAQTTHVPIGTLEGTVVSASGAPVPNASVTIQTSDGHQPRATRTDADGHFQFTRWETGQYDVRAYSNGVFSEWDKRILVRSNKTTKIILHIPASEQ